MLVVHNSAAPLAHFAAAIDTRSRGIHLGASLNHLYMMLRTKITTTSPTTSNKYVREEVVAVEVDDIRSDGGDQWGHVGVGDHPQKEVVDEVVSPSQLEPAVQQHDGGKEDSGSGKGSEIGRDSEFSRVGVGDMGKSEQNTCNDCQYDPVPSEAGLGRCSM